MLFVVVDIFYYLKLIEKIVIVNIFFVLSFTLSVRFQDRQ